jgi:hypothetical protein
MSAADKFFFVLTVLFFAPILLPALATVIEMLWIKDA